MEDFHLREKITHFDHERIPERVVHARGAAAHGFFQVYEDLSELTMAGLLTDPSRADAGLRPLLHRRGLARLDRHAARRARLCRQVLYRGRHLGPGRQQHAGLLHPGRHQVSRPDPRGEARAEQRDSAGAVGSRHLLGLRLADPRERPHADVGDERPRDPAQLRDDGRLRRPHLPAGQRQGQGALRQVPLEAAEGRPLAGLGRGAEDRRQGPRLSPPRPVRGDRARRLPRVGARPADRRGEGRAQVRLRPARPDQDHSRRSSCPSAASAS